MGEVNACTLNTYVTAASMKGIKLGKVETETEEKPDLRGFTGLDEKIIPKQDFPDIRE